MSRKALFVCLGLLGVAACATDMLAEIVPNGVQGRFIQIDNTTPTADGTWFHIGEVGAISVGTDLAGSSLGASATTTAGSPGHGGDGNLISGIPNTGGGAWTRTDNPAGAQIDLGATATLQSLFAYQRNDSCCQGRLSNFTISVMEDNAGSPGATVFTDSFAGTVPTNSSATFALGAGNTIKPGGDGVIGTEQVGNNARFVRLQNNGGASRLLHADEFEAFGTGVTPDGAVGNTSTNDLAASIHSVQGVGGHGADGNLINNVRDAAVNGGINTWTRDGVDSYVTLDLGVTTNVESLRVLQRTDSCCQGRLSNFTVSLLTDDGGSPGAVMASQSFAGTVATNSTQDFTFADDFTIGANDILEIEIDLDAMTADSLVVGAGGTGDLTIDPGATLNLIVSGLKRPQTFDILDFGSVNGMFDNINISGINSNLVALDDLLVNGQVTITPEPASIAMWTLLSLVLGAYVLRRKR